MLACGLVVKRVTVGMAHSTCFDGGQGPPYLRCRNICGHLYREGRFSLRWLRTGGRVSFRVLWPGTCWETQCARFDVMHPSG